MGTPLAKLLYQLAKYINDYNDDYGTIIRAELTSFGYDNHCININIRRKYPDIQLLQIQIILNLHMLDSLEGDFTPIKNKIDTALAKIELEYAKIRKYENMKKIIIGDN